MLAHPVDASAVKDSTEEGKRLATRPLVLVADDDPDFRATVVKALAKLGMRVAEVETGNALIAALGNVNSGAPVPDLVITDNHMPGCSGLTALAILQESGLTTPVIVMTGQRDASTATRAARYGAVALLHKPFEISELDEAITRALT